MESKFWSRSVAPTAVYNIKSEGDYTSSTATTTNGSCLASLMQVMEQSSKYNQAFSSSTSESMALVDMDQAKCGFSTVTSTQRNQYSKPLDSILDDSSLGLDAPSSELDCMWRLPYTVWNPQTHQEHYNNKSESTSPSPSHSRPAGGRFPSDVSNDSSLDGGVPASSTVSSTSDDLATGGADHEDDVYVDASSTSVEVPSLSNFALSSSPARMLSRPTIAIPPTCSEGSTLSTDQVKSCDLDSPMELESRLVDQTLPPGADIEQSSAAAGKLQLGNDGNIVLVQPQVRDAKQQIDRQQTSSSMELKWKHEAATDENESWSSKMLKPSPPSSPSSPAAAAALPVPYLTSPNGMNVNAPAGPHPFLMRNSSTPNVYQLPQLPALASPTELNKVPGPSGTKAPPFMAPHQFLFGANFPSVVNIDIREIENSRPKRRNVKISKDPQSVAARHRRERISDRIRVLQRLVPGGTKMDTASMLDEAISYVKYLKLQVQTLESCGNAGFDPRMQFPAAYYLPVRPVQGDCSTMSQISPGVAPEHGMYGAGHGQPTMKFADVYREQFCH